MGSDRSSKQKRIVICALETFSRIGGLQKFNQRVFQNVAARSVEGDGSAVAILHGDYGATLPVIEGLEIVAPANQRRFLAAAFRSGVFRASALIICHINLLPLAFAIRLFRQRLPIILFVHGYEVWNTQGSRTSRFYEAWLLKSVTQIGSVSRYTADRMAREFHVSPSKFRFLPNAVDLLEHAPSAQAQQPMTILTVARLAAGERDKNVHEMIAAVASLQRRLPNVQYEIVGDGELRPELEALALELGIANAVTFLGQIDDRALHEAYSRATVFAMPSNKEGFGIVYLEAWQYCKPVICSSLGAASEIVADGIDGFVVDPSNENVLVDRLYRLLTEPDLAVAMGRRGHEKVEQKYLNANFRLHLDKILDELLDQPVRVELVGERHPQPKF